jgi:hypothetical protein
LHHPPATIPKEALVNVIAAAPLVLGLVLSPIALASAQGSRDDRAEACRELIQASRITEEGQRSLQQVMRGARAPELMDRLMHLARALGGGDVNAGLERVIETAERQGREGGLLSPGPAPTR